MEKGWVLSPLQVTARSGPGTSDARRSLQPPTSCPKSGNSFLEPPAPPPWGQPHHHLDVPVVDGDAADVGRWLPVGNALFVQFTAAQDEAWGNLLSSHDCSPRSSGDPTHNPQAGKVLYLGPQGPRSRPCWLCSCMPQTSALLRDPQPSRGFWGEPDSLLESLAI